jgi:hypothetical protein
MLHLDVGEIKKNEGGWATGCENGVMFAWLISHQTVVLFSHNKSATNNQVVVLFSQDKPAPAISHQPNEKGAGLDRRGGTCSNKCKILLKFACY